MNTLSMIGNVGLALVAITLAAFVIHFLARRFPRAAAFLSIALLANDGALTAGEHVGGRMTGYLDSAPLTTRFLLVKKGNADQHYTLITSIADMPLAVCTDEPAATTDTVNFQWLGGCDKTQKMVAAAAINSGDIVVTNGDGKIKTLPAVAGVYWQVGVACTSATTSGDIVEVAPALQQVLVSAVT